MVTAITDDTFDDVIVVEEPVLVYFWASWSGPCKMMIAVLGGLAAEYDGRATFFSLDVDANMNATSKYGICKIPTLFVFKGGQPVDQIIGFCSKKSVSKVIDKYL